MDPNAVLDATVSVAMAGISGGGVLALWRLIRGPSLPDRIVALELIATLLVGMVALLSIGTRQPIFLDVAIVLALVGFLGAVAFARFLVEGTGR